MREPNFSDEAIALTTDARALRNAVVRKLTQLRSDCARLEGVLVILDSEFDGQPFLHKFEDLE